MAGVEEHLEDSGVRGDVGGEYAEAIDAFGVTYFFGVFNTEKEAQIEVKTDEQADVANVATNLQFVVF